jgi:hypothetical protein
MGPACINPERDIYAIPSRPSPTSQFRQEAIHIHFAVNPWQDFPVSWAEKSGCWKKIRPFSSFTSFLP